MSDVSTTIAAWEDFRRQRALGWYWLVGALRNGDIYHVCSLAAAFREHHGRTEPIYLVVSRAFQAKLASLFRDDFLEIVIAGDLPTSSSAWQAFFDTTQLPRFGLGSPLLLHPQFYAWGQFSIEFTHQTHRTWMDIYKKMLCLPADAEPSFPGIKSDFASAARALCSAVDMLPGRSVVFFPYAQSLPAAALAHFAELARDLRAEGYAVYTSVANAEVPVEGTEPLFTPFDLLIEIAEYAGWVVAIRSGICDITSSARCRKTYIYPEYNAVLTWSVAAMGLARDACEVPFDVSGGSPAKFSALVRSRADHGALAAPPRTLTSFIGVDGASLPVHRKQYKGDLALWSHERADAMRREGGVQVLFGVPNRAHPRLAAEVRALAEHLVDLHPTARFYACRDTTPFDVFEELDGVSLELGHYAAARFWHSLIVVAETGLEAALPSYAREALLPLQPVSPSLDLRIGDFWGTPDHIETSGKPRPLSLGGVQFLEGWGDLEPWGVWTNHLRSVLKLAVSERPSSDCVLVLQLRGCLSPAFPRIDMTIHVNDRSAGRHSVHLDQQSVLVELPITRIAATGRVFTVVLALDQARSPQEQIGVPDGRRLGLGLMSLRLKSRDGSAVDAFATA